jgi:hypothetical protein
VVPAAARPRPRASSLPAGRLLQGGGFLPTALCSAPAMKPWLCGSSHAMSCLRTTTPTRPARQCCRCVNERHADLGLWRAVQPRRIFPNLSPGPALCMTSQPPASHTLPPVLWTATRTTLSRSSASFSANRVCSGRACSSGTAEAPERT